MNPSLSQFNIRIPTELRKDVVDYCWSKGWNVQLAVTDWIRFGLMVAKYPEIHEQMSQVIENSKLVNIAEPDYVNLAIQQYKGIQTLIQMRKDVNLIPFDMTYSKPVNIMTHKELEV